MVLRALMNPIVATLQQLNERYGDKAGRSLDFYLTRIQNRTMDYLTSFADKAMAARGVDVKMMKLLRKTPPNATWPYYTSREQVVPIRRRFMWTRACPQ